MGVKEKMEAKMKQFLIKEKENQSAIRVLQDQIDQSLNEKNIQKVCEYYKKYFLWIY